LLIQLTKGSIAEKNGLKKGDVIISLDQHEVKSIGGLLKIYSEIRWKGHVAITIFRNQAEQKLEISLKD
jgi:C-terminal processing protease CtpA/Prc